MPSGFIPIFHPRVFGWSTFILTRSLFQSIYYQRWIPRLYRSSRRQSRNVRSYCAAYGLHSLCCRDASFYHNGFIPTSSHWYSEIYKYSYLTTTEFCVSNVLDYRVLCIPGYGSRHNNHTRVATSLIPENWTPKEKRISWVTVLCTHESDRNSIGGG